MRGAVRPSCRHQLTKPHTRDRFANLHRDARSRITERHVNVQLLSDGTCRSPKPLGPDPAHDLTHQVRSRACLLQQAHLRLLNDCTLGAGGNQAHSGLNQHICGPDRRARYVDDLNGPAASRLHNLFHNAPSPVTSGSRRHGGQNLLTGSEVIRDFNGPTA
jgi:hypothetical protein